MNPEGRPQFEVKEKPDFQINIVVHRHGPKEGMAGPLSSEGEETTEEYFANAYENILSEDSTGGIDIEYSPIGRTQKTAEIYSQITRQHSNSSIKSTRSDDRLSEGGIAEHPDLIEQYGGRDGKWLKGWMDANERPLPDVKTGAETAADFADWLLAKISDRQKQGGAQEIDAFSHGPVLAAFILKLEEKLGEKILPENVGDKNVFNTALNYLSYINFHSDSTHPKVVTLHVPGKKIDVGISILEELVKENKRTVELTPQDLEDREDFAYLLTIMEKQGATGITQPVDYHNALSYRDNLPSFRETEAPEGPITELFDDIIFDFDGVLYDSMYSVFKAIELTLARKADKHIPYPTTIEEVANSYQAPFQTYYKRFGISLETPADIDSFRNTFREVQAQVNDEHHTPAILFPETAEVLNTLKEARKSKPNLKVHIISAGSAKHINDVLVKYGIVEDFDEVHAECHDKSAMIKAIADKSGTPEKTVMIGDLPSDIKDAKKVSGVRTIAITRTERERDLLKMYLPNYIVNDLNGILNLTSHSRQLRETNEHHP